MSSIFNDPGFWHRLQFGFTIVYHYLFPQLTMGLAWFLVYWKWRALRTGDHKYNQSVRFWAKIFGLNFAVGVVTGIPMEFQFGTNWADFSKYAGGVIGQTLAMEGMFAFFLESAFVGALIWGEKRLGPRGHFAAAIAVALGSQISGYFILVTNSFMQHPVGYQIEANGSLGIASMSAYLLNPWAFVQFTHNQLAAVVTGSFVVAAIGAFYALRGLHPVQARLYLRAGTFVGLIASLQNWRGKLESSRLLLWVLMLVFPYPYIANTLGWMTAELGRQPWLIYGLFHTRDGYSKVVSNGDAIFTLIGFTGLYFVIGLLFLGLTGREIAKGPEKETSLVVDQREACWYDRDLVCGRQLHA